MNIFTGLYFPETMIRDNSFYSLLCLLDQIDYYLVVEDSEDHPPPGTISYWQGQAIVPLGEEREKFQSMIRDIRRYGAEFYENCLARLSADSGLDRDEASVWQLAAKLQEGKNVGSEKLLLEKLWQARVVLQLAEILEGEKVEIDRGLETVRRNEMKLFSGLRGDEEDSGDDHFSYDGAEINTGKAVNVDKVLPAWGVFHTVDSYDRPLLVTDNPDAAAILFEVLEEEGGGEAQLLVDLLLPRVSSAEDLEKKRNELAKTRKPVTDALEKIITGETTAGVAELNAAAGPWQKEVGKEKSPCGRTFSLYLLPGGYLGKAWERISGLAWEKTWPSQVLIGVLGRPG